MQRDGYRIQIVKIADDGAESVCRSFATQVAAQGWLLRHLSAINEAELAKWLREPRA
jgi:hypothetical protein